MTRNRFAIGLATMVFVTGFFAGNVFQSWSVARAQSQRVFELRTYTAPDGKLPSCTARFRDHTLRIFDKHGMTSVGYWVPQDAPRKDNTLIYLISHPAAKRRRRTGPTSRRIPNGRRCASNRRSTARSSARSMSVFMDATDYSPINSGEWAMSRVTICASPLRLSVIGGGLLTCRR